MATWSGAPLFGSDLGRALAISLLLHLALLWPSAPDGRTAVAASPLSAVLRPTGQRAGSREIPAVREGALSRLIGAQERAGPRKLVAVEDAEPRAAQAPVRGSSVESTPRDGVADRRETSLAPALPAALPAAPGLDAEGLRGFRLALAREARRYKHYPAEAIETGWQGTVEVEVTIRAGGVAMAALGSDQRPCLARFGCRGHDHAGAGNDDSAHRPARPGSSDDAAGDVRTTPVWSRGRLSPARLPRTPA